MIRAVFAALAFVLAVAPMAEAAAPQPAKPVALSSYTGRWFEIARTPNKLQRDCTGASVDYTVQRNRLRAVQRCTVAGEANARVFRSSGRILDPGVNAKARLTFAGFWTQEYWIIDHTADWALIGDPSGRYLWIMSRAPALAGANLNAAIARARVLGYDAGRLEFTAAKR